MDPKPRRRWFRFSLRTLLVLVTIASAGFGWLGLKIRDKERERHVVKAIREADGEVLYDYQLVYSGEQRVGRLPPGPGWLRNLLGEHFFANVVIAQLGPKTTDADLAHIVPLFNQLEELYLSETQLTDAGLVHLKNLKQLEELVLNSTQVTDAGLVHLRGLTKLTAIWFHNTQITKAGIGELQSALPNLKTHGIPEH